MEATMEATMGATKEATKEATMEVTKGATKGYPKRTTKGGFQTACREAWQRVASPAFAIKRYSSSLALRIPNVTSSPR